MCVSAAESTPAEIPGSATSGNEGGGEKVGAERTEKNKAEIQRLRRRGGKQVRQGKIDSKSTKKKRYVGKASDNIYKIGTYSGSVPNFTNGKARFLCTVIAGT